MIVLNEAIRRIARHIDSKIIIEADCGRAAGDWLRKDPLPSGQLFGGGHGRFVTGDRPGRVETGGGQLFDAWRGGFVGLHAGLFDLLQGFRPQESIVSRLHRPVHAQVPFADTGGAITVLLRQTCDGEPLWRNQRFPETAEDAPLEAASPIIATGENRVTRRRAGAGRRMPVGETHALGGQPIDVRRGDLAAFGAVALHIAVAKIVHQDDQDIRFGGRCTRCRLSCETDFRNPHTGRDRQHEAKEKPGHFTSPFKLGSRVVR